MQIRTNNRSSELRKHEHKPMPSSSIMNQNEFLFVQDKEPPPVQAWGKCKAMETMIVNQRTETTHK